MAGGCAMEGEVMVEGGGGGGRGEEEEEDVLSYVAMCLCVCSRCGFCLLRDRFALLAVHSVHLPPPPLPSFPFSLLLPSPLSLPSLPSSFPSVLLSLVVLIFTYYIYVNAQKRIHTHEKSTDISVPIF